MSNIRSDLYAFQYDIFQRYSLLQRLVSAAFPSSYADKLSILDVGCGASKLSSTFLGECVQITRADVSDFGESDIVVLDPGAPLPFPDQSFDVVMALEVLEHVPSDHRAALIAECRRVARQGVILCCPVADYGAADAEKVLNETVRQLADKDEAFLLEHALLGLPTLAEVNETLHDEGWNVASIPNAPLDHWLLFSIVDLIYAYDFGDSVQKDGFNAKINATAPLLQSDGRHYREFFIATRDNADTEQIRNALGKLRDEAPRCSADESLLGFATALPAFREDMQLARERILQPLIDDLRQTVAIQDAVTQELRIPFGAELQRAAETAAKAAVEMESTRKALEEASRSVAELDGEKKRLEELTAQLEGKLDASSRSAATREAEFAHISQALADLHKWMRRNPLVIVARILRRARRSACFRLTAGRVQDGDWLLAFRHSLPGRAIWRLLRKSAAVRTIAEQIRPRPIVVAPVPDVPLPDAQLPRSLVVESQEIAPTSRSGSYTPPVGLLPWFDPLNIELDRSLAMRPRLNVLVPGLAMKHMSGGPNTAISIAYRLAALGIPVRFVSTNAPIDANPAPFWAHAQALAGTAKALDNVELVDASDRNIAFKIGENDLFMATAWWTAQMAKYAIRHTRHEKFVYLIQDYEPILHPASTQYALAEETYRLDIVPVVNTSLLAEYLVSHQVGRFSDLDFARRTLAFEPAVDKTQFYFDDQSECRSAKRRLLFYARPTNGLRNLYEMGVAALQKLLADGALNAAEWEFVGMGEKFEPVPLGHGGVLVPAPWLGFEGYARQMRESDVLLSLMLSPHPSYPPLEMAACGKPVVTTCYANKTAERLAQISGNIIAVDATVESIANGLVQAVQRCETGSGRSTDAFGLPETWDESLASVMPQLRNAVLELLGAPPMAGGDKNIAYPNRVAGSDRWPTTAYEVIRYAQIADRRTLYTDAEPGLISFLTPVWNTDPAFVRALADSVFSQDCEAGFEWILLDNAPTREDVNQLLDELAAHPCVRLIRVEKNLGIVGGLRACLEAAKNRYVVPLDADDLIASDCVRVLTSSLKAAGYPALAYTDEDKCDETSYRDPYYKPDWDPVLFAHSCYISHLCAIDRTLALRHGAYTDHVPEGSHDWDTFMRFWLAGHTPYHIPEVLYTWRMHARSTAGDIHSKSYIYSSQSHVIGKLVKHSEHPDWYRVELSPMFDGTPDWRIVRDSNASKPSIITVLLGDSPSPIEASASGGPFGEDPVARLLRSIEQVRAPFVHLQSPDVRVADGTWQQDAQMLFELFPDTAVVGGRFKFGHEIVAADVYFGFGNGFDSPNATRNVADSGYFCQMWKPHSVSAVSAQHCVVRTELLREVLAALVGTGIELEHLGIWLGAAARRRNQRVVYTPFFFAESMYRPTAVAQNEALAFRKAFPDLVIDNSTFSRRLDLDSHRAFSGTSLAIRREQESKRLAHVELSWNETFHSDLISRRLAALSRDKVEAKFALLTLLYSRSPAKLFRKTAESVLGQTLPFSEWIILENGPIPEDARQILDELVASDSRIRAYKSEALGIVGGLRYCLERATADFIIPMDADDLLTVDALELMAEALNATDKPSFVFSDEDIQHDDYLDDHLRRADFDPVLNRADSYVWHACAFQRERALALNVYCDKGAEFCHDWDSVTRFADAGERIAHIPHVLYHWRAHATSSSNSGTVNIGSINSVKHVLQRSVDSQPNPSLYAVDVFPIDRGAEQYGILRLPHDPLSIAGIKVGKANLDAEAAESKDSLIPWQVRLNTNADWAELVNAINALTEPYVLWIDEQYQLSEAAAWEAMRLFEMHPDVALVSGRVLSSSNRVIASCEPQANLWSGRGMRRDDPGPFALALKPQTAVDVPEGFFFCRRELLQCVSTEDVYETGVAQALTKEVQVRGLRIAYSPLVEAKLL
ncbi:methyltransferase family protein [Paraburkholderia sp. BL6665CI2N2]|uniref:rhamnosyltransferase WsaF family glycosyltransferase n=1 Tax=Paraburkholderia sp. BL6665CI2N2 TaxID=1938806 RepID=UPI00106673DD|nr:glycosyltransferase [Paraburkholderia sp. BL6665CI2N2]TDY25468.1 methyltransferase family protein [Paraburkholderia sp. BL6665CI2N2]